MADEVDMAMIAEEKQWADFNAGRSFKVKIGPKKCECGEPIPKVRREHGFSDCVYCAELKESRL